MEQKIVRSHGKSLGGVGVVNEGRELLILHGVDIHLTDVVALRVLEGWQLIVDLVTDVQVPLGLDVLCELRG